MGGGAETERDGDRETEIKTNEFIFSRETILTRRGMVINTYAKSQDIKRLNANYGSKPLFQATK